VLTLSNPGKLSESAVFKQNLQHRGMKALGFLVLSNKEPDRTLSQ